MSIYAPKNWFRAPHGVERAWIGLALIWCIIMFLAMPYWHIKGKQNSTGEAYTVKPAKFVQRVNDFIKTNSVDGLFVEVTDANGNKIKYPVVEPDPAPNNHAYLLAKMWEWTPILRLKKGRTYKLHISSADIQHGFSLLPLNMNFQILPGYDHVLTLTPTAVGKYQIICNEYCGEGHHRMTGQIIVYE